LPPVVIEDPVINSPFDVPRRHFKFDDEGITNEIVPDRRRSSYFVPIPRAKKKGRQLSFDTEWTEDRVEENTFVNRVRERVAAWRQGGYVNVTRTTRRLLDYWTNPEREKKFFFCQIEALETVIYLTEVAGRYGDGWIDAHIKEANAEANPGLYRIAFKMATGAGKTVVMAMIIAWHVLNKLANSQDARFSDTFLVVTPGITIRDRLRVLLPNDPENYYRERDIVPPDLHNDLLQAKILITNFHAFLLRERTEASKLTKKLSGQEQTGVNRESPAQMVRRVCRDFANKKNIVVLNDEAHHCYRRRVGAEDETLKGDDRKEAETRNEQARVWISGLEAVQRKLGIRAVYDLSATPFFLRGSGYKESTLFRWVVSDFSLIDAIEGGIVKVPRVPVADESMVGEQPTYRDLWLRLKGKGLPKKGRGTEAVSGIPKLPAELQGALETLYGHYRRFYVAWDQDADARYKGQTPPVFIVVCANTNISKIVFDYIAGYDTGKRLPDGSPVLAPGALPIFSNVRDGRWVARRNTILVDSEQLESGDAMSDEFKKAAAAEIEGFKDEVRRRGGADADDISDADLLREVMNTVGKPGKLGEQIRCVVSVSMLTEGWDANTVTHILGVRAFGTQLLCEQVVGRGLRRMSHSVSSKTVAVNGTTATFDAFPTEYAEVFGVPFSFIPTAATSEAVKIGPKPTKVRALPERSAIEITFPRLIGYRFVLPPDRLGYRFDQDSRYTIDPLETPTWTEAAPIVGESTVMTLDELKARRPQEVAFLLAKLVLEKYFRQDGEKQAEKADSHSFDAEVQAWQFPRILQITKHWLEECVTCRGGTFPQMLLLLEPAHDAADRIYRSIVKGAPGQKTLAPILRPYDFVGSTKYVDFDTTRPTYRTDPGKCHVSHVVADTDSWEQKMAVTFEHELKDIVLGYVKNQNLGFVIPYTLNGKEHEYLPDFIARIDDGRQRDGEPDPLNLIVEVSGQPKKDKDAKVATARSLWVPAVNNDGRFGRWAFIEITDPWNATKAIRTYLEGMSSDRPAQPTSATPTPGVTKIPGVCGGAACIKGTRIPVWLLVGLRRQGATDADLLSAYPSLSPNDLAAAWQYYEANREEIDEAIEQEEADEPV
jgi:type III restriction enzyme